MSVTLRILRNIVAGLDDLTNNRGDGCSAGTLEPSLRSPATRIGGKVDADGLFRHLARQRIPKALAVGSIQLDRRGHECVALGVVQAHRYRALLRHRHESAGV